LAWRAGGFLFYLFYTVVINAFFAGCVLGTGYGTVIQVQKENQRSIILVLVVPPGIG
jgi:hypothetical protein